MPNSAHTYTPKNDSFEERIRSCKSVLDAQQNADISLKMTGDKDWSDRLGSPEELQYANQVAESSLQRAADSLELSELYYAKEQGMLTMDEVNQISMTKEKETPFPGKNTVVPIEKMVRKYYKIRKYGSDGGPAGKDIEELLSV